MQVNYERIKEIAGDDNELIKTLLELYVDTFQKCIKDLENSISLPADQAKKQWHDSNHELKGSSYNLGFTEFGNLCQEVENTTEGADKKQEIVNQYKETLGNVMEVIAKIDV